MHGTSVKNLVVVIISVVAMLMATGGVRAADQHLAHDFKLKIDGFEVALPVAAVITTGDFGAPVPFVLHADLGPLIDNREALIAASGVNDGLPGEITYNGTGMDVAGQDLHLKYHFTARKAIKVLGKKVGSVSTDGSVETWLAASVADNRLRLAVDKAMGDGGFKINISNDLVRIGADLFGLKKQQLGRLAEKADAFFGGDAAALGVPEELRAANVQFASARFAVVDGRPVLELTGSLTMGVEAWTALFKALVL